MRYIFELNFEIGIELKIEEIMIFFFSVQVLKKVFFLVHQCFLVLDILSNLRVFLSI